MNQKLSDWASIAEIISGIAVLVTLVFLVLEIRAGTNVTRASMYGDILDSLVENRTLRIEDSEFDSLVQQFLERIICNNYSRTVAVDLANQIGRKRQQKRDAPSTDCRPSAVTNVTVVSAP